MITWFRTWLYRIVFFGLSVPVVATVPISALFGRRAVVRHASFWSRMQTPLARFIAGIRVVEEGTRPAGPALYAAKHQAMFETLELQYRLGAPAMAIKEELTRIPVWGWATKKYGALIVDREGSSTALRQMLREAKEALADGRSILIFAEGTRVKPGEQPPLKSGFAGLYRMLGIPVVPVALNTGELLPRGGLMRSGTVTIRYGEPIPPGLSREEIEARVHAAINVLDVRPAD
jgi:1-acyl-sn-glycerol-3-phosphate acyltransferase